MRTTTSPASKPRLAGLAAIGIVTAFVTGFFMAPAAGVPESCAGTAFNSPDGRIKVKGESFEGIGEFPSASATAFIDPGQQVTFKMKWRNIDAKPRTIRVELAGLAKSPGYGIRYYLGSLDITRTFRSVETGNLRFKKIRPGGSTPMLKFVVKNKGAAPDAEIFSWVDGRYGGNFFPACDRVEAQVNPRP